MRLRLHQRVLVRAATDRGRATPYPIASLGTVARLCTDGMAWIALDQRSKVEAAHPYPMDDRNRSNWVLASPDDCALPKRTRKQRRTAARAEARPVPTMASFGKDHWSTLGYLETRICDYRGEPNRSHMRCDPKRHPLMAHEGSRFGEPSPTRLHGGVLLPDHDDWDCVDDLEREGLLENRGTGMYPVYRLTTKGERVAAELRAHKLRGGHFASFVIPDLRCDGPCAVCKTG